MSDLPTIESAFNDSFAHWQIRLPAAAIADRQRGRIQQAGWLIWYMFATDERGEYLDYYASHRLSDDLHVRLRADGRQEDLPAFQRRFVISRKRREAAQQEAEFYANNQLVAELLAAKGFDFTGDESVLARVNRHLLTTPPA